jgi:predicted CXXCH cytochrome family protein
MAAILSTIRRIKPRASLCAAGLASLFIVFFALGCQRQPPPVLPLEASPASSTATLPDPPHSPYLNTRSDVAFVGDAVCVKCHRKIAEAYANNPMARSLLPLRDTPPQEMLAANATASFRVKDLRFNVERQANEFLHVVQLGDAAEGRLANPVRYLLGSSRQGSTCLIEHDGFLFQSPISWFSAKPGWELAPGYETNQLLFFRQIGEECLFCHSNGATLVPGTQNHYQTPLFPNGHGIGCERCHGPGQLHVAARRKGPPDEATDHTIVNPAHLEPALRDAICEQCHLQGEARVVRRGLALNDYRPGLPLHHFLSVLVRVNETAESQRSVSELQQFYTSRCRTGSGGTMGCTACHDPHSVPAPEQRDTYYRDRCQKCHADKPCSLPLAVRREKSPADSCIACHMPKAASADVSHAALSDHRILRDPGKPPPPPSTRGGSTPLRDFHEALYPNDPDRNRNLGVAMIRMARRVEQAPARRAAAEMALPLLETALAQTPDDAEAQESECFALDALGRRALALSHVEKLLERYPQREFALLDAARLAAANGRTVAAVAYWQRALTVNSWQPSYSLHLAHLQSLRKDWRGAVEACRISVRLDPTSVEARRLLIRSLIELRDEPAARAEYEILRRLKPEGREELQRWFEGLHR